MSFDISQLTKDIKAKLELSEYGSKVEETGTVVKVSDGIAQIYGLEDCLIYELIEFPGKGFGMAMNLEKSLVLAILFFSDASIKEGDKAVRTNKTVSVPVGYNLLGRVVNALGEPIDGQGEIEADEFYQIERSAKGIIERKSVSVPLETGIKPIDSMIPIGLGQRELIIGDRQTGKTSIALDTIINQKGKDVFCVYVMIGQKQKATVEVVEILQKSGAMDYTIVVSAPASDSASMQYIAPFAACSMAEFFMEQGKNALIVYDNLTQHAVAYRTLSLLLSRPPGREAYPGDVFYLHSRLLERAACLSEESGGGTLTALPIIETQAGNISAYIPTNVISITDGQIFLESELFNSGILPAINPGISVSRVGGSAQTKAMKKVSGSLKLLYSQYLELKDFAEFGSDLDENTRKRLAVGERIVEILKQDEHDPIALENQIMIFFALLNGFLKDVPLNLIHSYEAELYEYMKIKGQNIILKLRQDDFSNDTVEELRKSVEKFTEQFLQKAKEV
ncbi:MAG: F0F1 ATP synthase subunit alpha [Lachnospiraceae bacterium]|jgi:F-type H+-transporting ATPase subunit alpha|nr:F0F1 ATP synthase subunit alpha [Lachnospiraceae bacterium]